MCVRSCGPDESNAPARPSADLVNAWVIRSAGNTQTNNRMAGIFFKASPKHQPPSPGPLFACPDSVFVANYLFTQLQELSYLYYLPRLLSLLSLPLPKTSYSRHRSYVLQIRGFRTSSEVDQKSALGRVHFFGGPVLFVFFWSRCT